MKIIVIFGRSAYTHSIVQELEIFAKTERTDVKQVEDIEILRFLMIGTPILMVKCSPTECAVDTPEDVLKVERVILQSDGAE